MGSTALDDEKKHPGLAQDIDRHITYALHLLGESGVEETAEWKYRLRRRGTREETIKAARAHFASQLKTWQSGYREEGTVLFFERMRERCYDLYDKTNAWDTITALVQAVSDAIAPQLVNETSAGNGVVLTAISQFLPLLDIDIAIYKAVNRGHTQSVIDNCLAAQPKAQEIVNLLGSGGSSDQSAGPGDGALLRKELLAEAHALHEVYGGIYQAAAALAGHEDVIRKYYRDHPGPDDVPGARPAPEPAHDGPQAGAGAGGAGAGGVADGPRPWPDHRVTSDLHDARHQVRTIIRGLEEEQRISAEELGADSLQRATDIASRLNPWASLLRSVAKAYGDSKPMRLPTVTIRYCFPFAVKVRDDKIGELSSGLRKRVPGAQGESGRGRRAGDDDAVPRLASVLDAKLPRLHRDTAVVKALELTDFWAGAGEGMYGGNTVTLPGLGDKHQDGDEWRVWVDLSRLENHCLCIERTLKDPTPHQLYEALRCPADYSRDTEYRYGWAEHRSWNWRGLDEFAHDVILVMAQGLAEEDDPEYIKGHFHMMILVDTDASITELDGRYGAELLRTNVNRDAATLEEWVRYPVTKSKGRPKSAQGNFGYKENSWSVLDDTTIFGVAGNPSWQADAYLEAVQFAASWTPRLLLWNRELLQALEEPVEKRRLPDLRDLEQTVRRSVAFAHAEELCRLRSDRRYLEWMMKAVGTTSIQEDLERRIHTMRLLIDETEKKEHERLDGRRNIFLGAIAVFGVLNLSSVFAVVDSGDQSGLFKSHSAISVELIFQFAIFVAVAATFAVTWRWRKDRRRANSVKRG